MKDFDYQHWLAAAHRHARRRGEAADLLHDALLHAIRADRTDFSREENRRWFTGVLRNRAAMTARSAVRRRNREIASAAARTVPRQRSSSAAPSELFLRSLPTSARSVAALVVSGMNRREIVAALHLTDTSFRQRLTTIRKAWNKLPAIELEPAVANQAIDSDLALGLMRRALLGHLRHLGGGGAVGTHDPDGHLIVLETRVGSKKS